jgi:hypothetical protein
MRQWLSVCKKRYGCNIALKIKPLTKYMNDNLHISSIPGNEILIIKRSFNYYLTVITIPGFFLFFLTLGLVGRLSLSGALTCFLFFGGIVYAYFGRYLGEVKLYKNRIEVQYIFPWNHPLIYTFNSLMEVDHKEMPGLGWNSRWYRGYQLLYIKNDKEQVCQIRYNINDSSDEILVDEIRKYLV